MAELIKEFWTVMGETGAFNDRPEPMPHLFRVPAPNAA
jgi:hypothetical protein